MRIALVPTMGCLHEGHLSLLRTAAARADFVFCSIYVNESQFAPGEDYQSYPRRLEADLEKLRELGCVNCSFTPKAMYAQGTCIGGGEDGHGHLRLRLGGVWVVFFEESRQPRAADALLV